MSWFSKNTNISPEAALKSARIKAALMSLPFAAMGFVAFIILVHDGVLGGLTRTSAIKLGSVIVVAAGFVVLIFGVVAKKTSLAEQLKASLSEDPDKPWLKRADWASGHIKSAGVPDARSYLIMGIVLCVLGGLISVLLLPKAFRPGGFDNLVALVFPVVGIAFLASVIGKIRAHRRFGDCFFDMPQVPASPGGVLQGTIRTVLPMKPEQKLRVQISCVRRTVAGAGQHRRAEEKILWEDKVVAKVSANAPSGSNILVQFELPPGQPQSSDRGNQAILWRLEAVIPALNFHASFEVPVFKAAVDSAPVK